MATYRDVTWTIMSYLFNQNVRQPLLCEESSQHSSDVTVPQMVGVLPFDFTRRYIPYDPLPQLTISALRTSSTAIRLCCDRVGMQDSPTEMQHIIPYCTYAQHDYSTIHERLSDQAIYIYFSFGLAISASVVNRTTNHNRSLGTMMPDILTMGDLWNNTTLISQPQTKTTSVARNAVYIYRAMTQCRVQWLRLSDVSLDGA